MIDTITIPILLIGRVRVIEVLVIPSLTDFLILDIDFWRKMEIVPDLSHGEWKFSQAPEWSL